VENDLQLRGSYESSPLCSTVQGLLDWFEVDLGFTKLCLFRLICVLCVCMSRSLLPTPPTTGWRRCIGCLKLQVSFRKGATNYRVLLRKMTYQDKAPYASSPPSTDRGLLSKRDLDTHTQSKHSTHRCHMHTEKPPAKQSPLQT